MNCRNCGKSLPTAAPGGRRVREFCNNACKQAYWRQAHHIQAEVQESGDLAEARERIAELEQENMQLRGKLDIERRFYADHEQRSLKAWLRKQPPAHLGELGRRLQTDTMLHPRGSRAWYQAQLRAQGYTKDELAEFEQLWKAMLLQS